MSGIDFLLERRVPLEALRDVLAAVSGGRVEVVRDIEDATGDHDLLATLFDVEGDFRTHVATYGTFGRDDVRAVGRRLGMPALVGDESANPFAFVLLRPDGGDEAVGLDPEAMDRHEYRLLH